MVQTLISLEEQEDRVLNVVKGKYGFRNKSQAVSFIIQRFEKEELEPALRPEYAKELLKIHKGKHYKVSNPEELRKLVEKGK